MRCRLLRQRRPRPPTEIPCSARRMPWRSGSPSTGIARLPGWTLAICPRHRLRRPGSTRTLQRALVTRRPNNPIEKEGETCGPEVFSGRGARPGTRRSRSGRSAAGDHSAPVAAPAPCRTSFLPSCTRPGSSRGQRSDPPHDKRRCHEYEGRPRPGGRAHRPRRARPAHSRPQVKYGPRQGS